MPEDRSLPYATLALNTKVEEDFVAPLTAVRGALEILRDTPDLTDAERQRFLDTALRGCGKLGDSIQELAATVYASSQTTAPKESVSLPTAEHQAYASRVFVLDSAQSVEIDISNFEFRDAKTVNDFYDAVDDVIIGTGRKWYFLVNYDNCRIWPEAWVAFAHRGKKINAAFSLGTVRYAAGKPSANDKQSDRFDPDLFDSRESALAHIDVLKLTTAR